MKLNRDVYIAGVGETTFGKHKKDFDELGREAAMQAIGIVQYRFSGYYSERLRAGMLPMVLYPLKPFSKRRGCADKCRSSMLKAHAPQVRRLSIVP